jgi:copper transport protein
VSRLGSLICLLSLVLAGVLALPTGVAAHALLKSSSPAAGATLAAAPTEVTLAFSETPDAGLSSISVLDEGGTDHATGPVQAPSADRTSLRVAMGQLPDGVYTVTWRAVSAVDGHTSAGAFAFGVGVAPTSSAPSTGETPSASLPATIARWLLYVGLVALLGVAFVAFAVEPNPPRSVVRLAGIGWVLSVIGTVGVIAVQWLDTGADLPTLLSSSTGLGALERVAGVVATGITVAIVFASRGAIPRPVFGVVAAAAAGAMLADVLNGHAAAGSLPAIDVIVQWLHVVGVGCWIGGLVSLLLIVRGSPTEAKSVAVRRFSRWAGYGIAVVAATGAVRALSEVGSLGALIDTDFGRLIVVKSALLGLLAVLGASNRFFMVPTAIRSMRGLRRIASTELVVGATVLAVTAVLVNLAPPSSAGAAPAQPQTSVVATGNDFGTSLRLRLVVSPGAAGENQFSALVTDYDSGEPAAVSGVSLRFDLASRSGVGSSTLELASSGPGTFAASSRSLSIDGIWKVTATVSQTGGAVEVPIVLATAVPAQHVEVNAAPGAPTIDTVHLDDGSSIQLYLDPGRTGDNQLHATFFDASGSALPVRSATFLVTTDAGAGRIVAGRQLEPGHFVADVSAAGDIVVDVVGPNPAKGQLHAHLRMEVQP